MPGQKKFSDFAKDILPLDGPKIKIDAIINKEVTITGFKIMDSKFEKNESSRCLTLQIVLDGHKYVLFTGSIILIEQITKYQCEIPFVTTIKKIDRYYTFS
ncbi:MAG TPA: hypothetical protein ACFYEK_17745 [Candidatus Wunengus sp. YC60]|uniref:hypothetical protein n=1 Tax=Candidatus Wunengus sp. YC60 TaxID=3367697 RepID=UPI0040283B8E